MLINLQYFTDMLMENQRLCAKTKEQAY